MHVQEICDFCHNYFDNKEDQHHAGTFTIADGTISPLPLLKEGQRFEIAGSVLNNGIYTWHVDGIRNDDDDAGAGLADETFSGAIIGLSVPPQLVALAAEKKTWEANYGDVISGPFNSENFGGYGYTRATGKDGAPVSWIGLNKHRIPKEWRKVARL